MIDGGWSFIWAAYAITLGVLAVLALVVAVRLAHWSKRARASDEAKRGRTQ
jgi:hypothetical protein